MDSSTSSSSSSSSLMDSSPSPSSSYSPLSSVRAISPNGAGTPSSRTPHTLSTQTTPYQSPIYITKRRLSQQTDAPGAVNDTWQEIDPKNYHHEFKVTLCCSRMNSLGWKAFDLKPLDVVIQTCYKSGTTWTQQIVTQIFNKGKENTDNMHKHTIWVEDPMFGPLNPSVKSELDNMTSPRVLKSHAPLSDCEYDPQVKYVCIMRSGKDVVASYWNHQTAYTEINRQRFSIPRWKDFDHFFDLFMAVESLSDDAMIKNQELIAQGKEPTEKGPPFWSLFRHNLSWWNARHLPNVLLIHFNDLKSDLRGSIQKIAQFIEAPALNEEELNNAVYHSSFAYMKKNEEKFAPADEFEKGRFIFKGSNQRWRHLLSPDHIRRYEEKAAKYWPPEMREWLERDQPERSGNQAGDDTTQSR